MALSRAGFFFWKSAPVASKKGEMNDDENSY